MEQADWDAAFEWAEADADGSPAPDEDAPAPGEPFSVWADNWPVVCLFLKCETQWTLTPGGRVVGFNYPGVEVVMRHNKKIIPDADMAFEQLQMMEAAARGVLNGAVVSHD